MQIKNETGMLANATPQYIRADATILTIMVKGTFTMNDQGAPVHIADLQRPILWGDEMYEGEVGCVRLEGELLPFKPKSDVIAVGKALAPGGTQVTQLPVSVSVGNVSKSVMVYGDRFWRKDSGMPPKVSQPAPFAEMAISYEQAFGGYDMKSGTVFLENPVGKGIIDEKMKVLEENVMLPNVEDPESLIRSWQDRPAPAGFGPLGRGWPSRLELMGTYDEKWQAERAPDPPEDFSSAFYNCAPEDLQSDTYFQGNEPVEVTNMSPSGVLTCQLPGLVLGAVIETAQSDSEDVEELMNPELPTQETQLGLNLDTVTLFPNEEELTLIWRGFLYIKSFSAAEVRKIEIKMETLTP